MDAELGFLSPVALSCVSSEHGGFGSSTCASSLEKLLKSPSSCVSDGRGDGGGFGSPTWESQLEALLDSASSRVTAGFGSGGFSLPTWEPPVETLLDPPSSCFSDGFDGGNGGYRSLVGVPEEKRREVLEAERFLRAIAERNDDCFNCLRDATAELVYLRRERLRLIAENLHLSFLLEDLEHERRKQALAVTPAPTLPPKRVEEDAVRGGAPKSISIRSNGFLSEKQPQGDARPRRLRVRAPPVMEEAGEVEVEAFRQGAARTELCHRWERGLPCPFGRRCRFAHGPQELRPVIRHPRYKTLPCQLFTAASGCPYGHRCHFRHSQPQPQPQPQPPLPVAVAETR